MDDPLAGATRPTVRAAALVLLLLLPLLAATAGGDGIPGPAPDRPAGPDGPLAPPAGYLGHRPILEFFTGLSCPSCMAGPHPETEELYGGIADDEAVPWTYVVFHELNGGGEDGLATDESRARMRHYQPGVSGTPAIEVDGGWHTLGGFYGRESITTSGTQAALDDASARYERQINPRRPIQSLRNDFKFANLEVEQHYQGGEWAVVVRIEYLGMDRPLLEEDLRGSLYVFMVEDNVTAWSTVEEAMVPNRNVFRGYAIEAQEVTMAPGEEQLLAGGWTIPDIEVDPGQDYPEGEPVPVKPMDLTAVAALYDLDDTTSSNGANGNPNPVPRCIQSATPQSTAYDKDNTAEPVGEVKVERQGDDLRFEAAIADGDGVASAAIFWTSVAANATSWQGAEMGLSGEEVCDDEGVCYAYSDATASATLEGIAAEVGEVWFVVTYTDGLGAMARTEVLYHGMVGRMVPGGGSGVGGGVAIAAAMAVILVLLAVVLFRTKDAQNRRALAAVMVLVLIVGSVFALSAGGEAAESVPDIEFTDIDGNTVSLGDFEGRVVVLDMMATWCPTCRKAMPDLREVHERYGDSIELVTIDIDLEESTAQLRDFKREYKAGWRFAMDTEDQDFLKTFNVQEIPKIVVIDIHGGVVYSRSAHVSADDLSEIIDEAAMGGRGLVSLGAGSTSAVGLLMWAIGLGVLTFFSPCSFPLLPGYMTYYLGLRDSRNQRKALYGGMAAAAGIVLLFLVVAILVGLFGNTISQYVLYLEPVVGVLLIVMAVLILLDININFGLLTYPVKKGLAFSRKMVGRLRGKWRVEGEAASDDALGRAAEEGGYVGLFFYGLGYGAASAGCMAPVVIALIVLAASQGTFLGAFGVFLVFALAMAALMVVITMAVGQYGTSIIQRLKVSPRGVKLFSSVLLIAVGVWILFYFASGIA